MTYTYRVTRRGQSGWILIFLGYVYIAYMCSMKNIEFLCKNKVWEPTPTTCSNSYSAHFTRYLCTVVMCLPYLYIINQHYGRHLRILLDSYGHCQVTGCIAKCSVQ